MGMNHLSYGNGFGMGEKGGKAGMGSGKADAGEKGGKGKGEKGEKGGFGYMSQDAATSHSTSHRGGSTRHPFVPTGILLHTRGCLLAALPPRCQPDHPHAPPPTPSPQLQLFRRDFARR